MSHCHQSSKILHCSHNQIRTTNQICTKLVGYIPLVMVMNWSDKVLEEFGLNLVGNFFNEFLYKIVAVFSGSNILLVISYASVRTRRAPPCGGSASDLVAETQRTIPPTHVTGACFERRRSTQRARSSYWTMCNNCCVSCENVADTCVQCTAVHLWRALPVRFGRPANANLMPAGTSTAVPPTYVPGATDVRVTQRTQPPHTCSAANVRVTHIGGTASVLSVGII